MSKGFGNRWVSFAVRYGVAGFVSILAVSVKVQFPEFEQSAIPALLLAITISSCLGGLGPGLLASAIVSLGHLYYFIPPVDSFAIQSSEAAIQFMLFALCSFLISSITASLYEAKERLRRAGEQATEAAQRKLFFVSNVTHEIRTPINAIVGLSRVLADEHADPVERPFLIQKIQDASQILLHQVNDVLDYSKLESGKFNLVDSTFNLSQQLQRALDLVTPLAKGKAIQFVLKVDPNLPAEVTGDLNRILQILWNLLSNAIKFTAAGTIQVNVQRELDLANELQIRFEVVDSGIGILENDQENIFLPFIQSELTGVPNFGGTGLGLTICKKLVQLMGGEIGLTSRKDQGSTFWFRLKMQKPHAAASLVEQKNSFGPNLDFITKDLKIHSIPLAVPAAKKILAVDDNELNILVLKKYAQKLGYKMDVAKGAIDAIGLCAENKYVAVLMDCQMPQLDGYAVTRAIRSLKDAEKRAVPIVATTAYVSDEVRAQCKDSGMDDFITKPIDLDELEEKLKFWSTPPQAKSPISITSLLGHGFEL